MSLSLPLYLLIYFSTEHQKCSAHSYSSKFFFFPEDSLTDFAFSCYANRKAVWAAVRQTPKTTRSFCDKTCIFQQQLLAHGFCVHYQQSRLFGFALLALGGKNSFTEHCAIRHTINATSVLIIILGYVKSTLGHHISAEGTNKLTANVPEMPRTRAQRCQHDTMCS